MLSRFIAAFLLAACFTARARSGTGYFTGKDSVPATDTAKQKKLRVPDVRPTVDLDEWRGHLEFSLTRIIKQAVKAGVPSGRYTVYVGFIVEKDGSISNVKALNDPGFGLGDGAVETVTKGPEWTAGERKGKKIRSYHKQPITFIIGESNPYLNTNRNSRW